MWTILFTVASWLVREVIVKASVVGGLYWLVSYLMPQVLAYVAPFMGVSSLNALFAAVPDGLYWFLYALKFDVGVPLLLSAWMARFLIRRIPGVG
jgi:hypothetical protein